MATSRRRWLFRLTAIALALLPWLIAELTLQAIGWPVANELQDPFIGFDAQRTLFELSEDATRYQIASERQVYFRPASFPAEKSRDEFRIFVVGGSTVQGRPYATETAFSTWLQLALQQADDSRRYTVVNCGGVSYAAYRLVPIVHELLQYDPDLIILCTGNNEFLEQRTYEDYLSQPRWQRRVWGWVRQSALVRAAQQALLEPASPAEELPSEVDARLDYQDAMQQYQRDDALAQAVATHFEDSLERIGLAVSAADVPLWLVLPLTNLRDCPPFKSQPAAGAEDVSQRLSAALASGWFERSVSERIALLESLLSQDDRLALAYYWLGRCYDEQGDFGAARQAYQRAIDEDICPLRATSPLFDVLHFEASRWNWPLVDTPELLSRQCPGEILDNTVLDDHVHPSIDAHQQIGVLLFTQLAERLPLSVDAEVKTRIEAKFNEHLAGLPTAYFEHGQQRLKALNLWARGRAIGAKPDPQHPQP